MGWRTIQAKNQVERQGSINGVRILEQSVILRETTDGQAQTGLYRRTTARNPSSRLTMSVEVFFEPESAPTDDGITDYESSMWLLRAQAMGLRRDRQDLHPIPDEQIKDLPRSYEVVSGVKILSVVTELYIPTRAAVTIAGAWIVRAYWEPVVPMDDKELLRLFNDCSITVGAF